MRLTTLTSNVPEAQKLHVRMTCGGLDLCIAINKLHVRMTCDGLDLCMFV